MTDQTMTVYQAKAANDRLVALTAIQKVLKGMTEEARTAVLVLFQDTGTKSMLCQSADEVELGTVSRKKGTRTVKVADKPAFLAWVRANHPLWVEEDVAADPWTRLKREYLVWDAPCTSTGNVIPGLVLADGEVGRTVRVTRDAEARMADVVAGVLPELTAEATPPGLDDMVAAHQGEAMWDDDEDRGEQ